MTQILELSDREFQTPMVKMLSAPMGKAANTQERMNDVSREKENLRNKRNAKNQKHYERNDECL